MQENYFIVEKFVLVEQKSKKTIAYKHIDNFRPKERYQMDTVYLSDYLVSDKRYLFTMVDHFSKFGWAVVIYNKK